MLLATALNNIGKRVVYKAGTPKEDYGVITDVHIKHDSIFVQYDGDEWAKSTRPEDLQLVSETLGPVSLKTVLHFEVDDSEEGGLVGDVEFHLDTRKAWDDINGGIEPMSISTFTTFLGQMLSIMTPGTLQVRSYWESELHKEEELYNG